ncbi:unnamed protein product [Caenorhabditis bovis]|uniref:DUF19 domain-containing protein n=1 Tax=Caenorhabditis bovis TaxID=2654633 RepID=A0A8S1ETK9_9PELO|nr:unnamed protein product [Caenorhabditis bovis]
MAVIVIRQSAQSLNRNTNPIGIKTIEFEKTQEVIKKVGSTLNPQENFDPFRSGRTGIKVVPNLNQNQETSHPVEHVVPKIHPNSASSGFIPLNPTNSRPVANDPGVTQQQQQTMATTTEKMETNQAMNSTESDEMDEGERILIAYEQIREELLRILEEEAIKKELATKADDPACGKLRQEYDDVCFQTPPLAAFQETREFCLAFVKNCRKTLSTNLFTNLKNFKIDFSRYCKKHRERFRYVCPDPLRFFTFAEEAVQFCIRYKDRCAGEPVPSEPIAFKRKDADHIYTREIEYWCTREKRTAYNYCTEPDLIKTPRYQPFCFLYKYACIDIYQRVIYG